MNSVRETGGFDVHDVVVGTQRLRVATRLSGEGPPLLLCNGIGVNWEVFLPLARALPGRGLIAFDVPGVGASPLPSRPYTMAGMAGHVQELLDRLAVPVVDVLGVSWGGALAQQLACTLGRRCRRLVLAATSTGWFSVPGRWSALRELADARRFSAGGPAGGVLSKVYGGRVARDPNALRSFVRHLDPPSQDGYRLQMAALGTWTSAHWLALLPQPALILAGREDPLVPLVNAHILRLLLRGSQMEVVDDGHLFLHTSAEEVAVHIAGFLSASGSDMSH